VELTLKEKTSVYIYKNMAFHAANVICYVFISFFFIKSKNVVHQ